MSDRVSRITSSIVVPANGGRMLQLIRGDYFHIVSASGTVTLAVNRGGFTPCPSGLIQRYPAGNDEIEQIEFYNASGSDVTVVVVYGRGDMQITGQVNLSSSDLLSITPAAATVATDFQDITGSTAFAAKKSITVINTGSADITVTGAGAARTLSAGETVNWSTLRQQDTLNTITVNATGGNARVIWQA